MKLTPLDAKIIRLLAMDSRMPALRLAEELGEPESTVRSRIAKLVDARLIEFVAQTDPAQMGYSTWVMIGLKVELPSVGAVVDALSTLEEVYFIAVTTGGFDVMLNAVFADNAALHRFLTERLGAVPGIRDASTFHYLDVAKRRLAILPRAGEGVPDRVRSCQARGPALPGPSA